ncbi:MAG: DNA-binding protein, partial [Anderseniella sp.]|nr:DNA-binding protein [Anderseniella sp.]
DEDTLVSRVRARKGDASDATADVVRKQLARGAGEIGWNSINAAGSPDDSVAACEAAMAGES